MENTNSKNDVLKFVLSHADKIALVEAKTQRAQAYLKALSELAKKQETSKGAKYSI